MAVADGLKYRRDVLLGVNKLADAVRCTFGPRGRNVAMYQKAGVRGADYSDATTAGAHVLMTNDGVTIAQSIVLADAVQNMGAQLCREVASTANREAGDGTTAAIVLAQDMLNTAFRYVEAGVEPLAMRRGLKAAERVVLGGVREAAIAVDSEEALAHVAAISCQDGELGRLIGEALFKVGAEGVVNVDDSQRTETYVDLSLGITFDRGFVSPYMATDSRASVADLENPYILLTDAKITNEQDLIPALICAAEDGRDCLVVSDGVEGEALTLVLTNNRQGDMNVACVVAPGYGEGRRWRMEDLAVQTGGMVVSQEAGMSLRDVTRDMLGSARRIKVTKDRTVIMDGGGDPELVAQREAQIRHYAEHTDYEFNRKRHQERLASFVSGVATIKVGGVTEPEQWERKMRVEDAVNAARSAMRGGIVAGGGTMHLLMARRLEELLATTTGDERFGVMIALDAMRAPVRQIADNAGKNGAMVVERVMDAAPGMGYDAGTDTIVDMVASGIIDPAEVVSSSLTAAFSVVETALSSEVGVVGNAAVLAKRKEIASGAGTREF